VDAELVMCPLHDHQFRLATGACVSGGEVADVAAYTATDDDGELVVSLVAPQA
jgi:nitrite reductase (NADH) small subunit